MDLAKGVDENVTLADITAAIVPNENDPQLRMLRTALSKVGEGVPKSIIETKKPVILGLLKEMLSDPAKVAGNTEIVKNATSVLKR